MAKLTAGNRAFSDGIDLRSSSSQPRDIAREFAVVYEKPSAMALSRAAVIGVKRRVELDEIRYQCRRLHLSHHDDCGNRFSSW